jgi:hypothetical protein
LAGRKRDKFEIIKEKFDSMSLDQLEVGLKRGEQKSKNRWLYPFLGFPLVALIETLLFFVFQKSNVFVLAIFYAMSVFGVVYGLLLRKFDREVLELAREIVEEKRRNV